jgi:hypothetical protein
MSDAIKSGVGGVLGGARHVAERIPVVGGLFQSIFGSPEEEAHQRMLQQAAQAYAQYRPQNMQTRMNAFQNMSNAFTPMNNLMGQMYGSGAQQDMSKLVQNPFPQQMQDQMNIAAYGPNDRSPQALGMIPNPNQTPDEKAKNINAFIPSNQSMSGANAFVPNQYNR